jgi:hypothetical protein
MQTCKRLEVKLRAFLTSTLDVHTWSVSLSDCFVPEMGIPVPLDRRFSVPQWPAYNLLVHNHERKKANEINKCRLKYSIKRYVKGG